MSAAEMAKVTARNASITAAETVGKCGHAVSYQGYKESTHACEKTAGHDAESAADDYRNYWERQHGAVRGTGNGSASEIFQEGTLYPPIRYVSRGELVRDIDARTYGGALPLVIVPMTSSNEAPVVYGFINPADLKLLRESPRVWKAGLSVTGMAFPVVGA